MVGVLRSLLEAWKGIDVCADAAIIIWAARRKAIVFRQPNLFIKWLEFVCRRVKGLCVLGPLENVVFNYVARNIIPFLPEQIESSKAFAPATVPNSTGKRRPFCGKNIF